MKILCPNTASPLLSMLISSASQEHNARDAQPPKNATMCKMLGSGLLRRATAWVLLASALYLPLFAQQGNGTQADSADHRRAADTNWRELEARQLPSMARGRLKDDEKTSAERKQEMEGYKNHFLTVANDAKSFRDAYKDHSKSARARLLEATSLLKAQMLGAQGHEERASILVEALKGDVSLSRDERYAMLMMAEYLLVRSVARNSTDAPFARKESARYLILEFPEQAGGYLSLLQVADATEEATKVRFVADEIRASPAPFAAKAQAEILVERYALIGKSLADVANTALGRDNFFEKCRNRRVLLYTWSRESKHSMRYAREMVERAAPGVLVVGYNLDRDIAAAKAAAAAQKLPGHQYYNEGGIGSQLALLLKLNATPLVYLTDAHGIIRDVNGQRGKLADRIAAHRAP